MMKKLLLILVLSILSIGAQAQIIESRSSKRSVVSISDPVLNDWNRSGMFMELGIGALTGDPVDSEFAVNLGLGYRWHAWNGICWDILKLNANTGVSHFTEMLYARLTTGVRYQSPRFIAGKALYANFNLGYGLLTDPGFDTGAFCYELGAGFLLTRNISLGIQFQGNGVHDDYWDENCTYGMLGLNFGIMF